MLRQSDEIEMQDFADKESALQAVAIADNTAGILGSASLGTSYSGFFLNYFNHPYGAAITGVGSYILFPIIILSSAAEAVCSWLYTLLDRRKRDNELKKRNILNAIVSTVSFIGFGTAIVGSLVAATTFAVAAPVIFMSIIAARILYNAGAAVYWAYKSATVKPETTKSETGAPEAATTAAIEKSNARKEKYAARAKEHAKGAGLGLLALVATTAVFLLGYFVVAPVGIAVNIVFLGLSIMGLAKGIKHFIDKPKPEAGDAEKKDKMSDTPDIETGHKATKSAEPSVTPKENQDALERKPLLSGTANPSYTRDWSTDTGIFTLPRREPDEVEKKTATAVPQKKFGT